MTTRLLTTREVAGMLGVGTTSVKRWAEAGVIECVKTPGGHRRFPRSVVERMLGNVDPLAPPISDPDGWIRLLVSTTDPRRVSARLATMRDELGSWWAVARALGAVVEELGVRWNHGEVTVLDEHLASARLGRALARCAEDLSVPQDAPAALLLAADGEEHTLGLSMVELCLRASGWNTYWGGTSVPHRAVRTFVASGAAQLVAVSASVYATNQSLLEAQAERLGELCAQHRVELVLGGQGRWPDQPVYGRRIRSFDGLKELLAQGAGGQVAHEDEDEDAAAVA